MTTEQHNKEVEKIGLNVVPLITKKCFFSHGRHLVKTVEKDTENVMLNLEQH